MNALNERGRAARALLVFSLACGCSSAWSADVLFSRLFPQGRTADSYIIQISPPDVLVFDAPATGKYVLHGKRLIIVAQSARVDAAVAISAFDDTDASAAYTTVAPKGADGANGVGETNFKGNPASPGNAPSPLTALQGVPGADAKEIVIDIANLTGAGKLSINASGARGGKGQTGGKGGTGGQGGRGHDGSDAFGSCKESGGDGGTPGVGGSGGTGGTGGTGGKGASVILSAPLFGPPISTNLEVILTGGLPGDPGDPGEHGNGGASADGGSGSKFCGGGNASGAGANGPEGAKGNPGVNGGTGVLVQNPN